MKKKILMCYQSSQYGGVEFQILDIISGLSHDYEIIVACPEGPLSEKYIENGAKWINLYPKSEFDFQYVRDVANYVRENKIDIVHAHELKSGVLATIGAFFGGAKKRVYHVHTPFIFWQYSSIKRIIALPVNFWANFIVTNLFATDVIALTPYIKKVRIFYEWVNPLKIRIIPNAVKKIEEPTKLEIQRCREKYSIPESDYVIGYVARFSREKGHGKLIYSYETLLHTDSKLKNSKLLLVGGGDLLDECKDLAEKLKISQNVVFTDRVSDQEKFVLMKLMNLYIFPTLAEGFGISLIEAMRMKIPTLASDLPVLKDVGEDGIDYFLKGDYEAMIHKIRQFLNEDSEVIQNRTFRAYEISKKYSLERFYDNYRKVYGV